MMLAFERRLLYKKNPTETILKNIKWKIINFRKKNLFLFTNFSFPQEFSHSNHHHYLNSNIKKHSICTNTFISLLQTKTVLFGAI